MKKSARDIASLAPAARAYCVEGALHNWSMADPALFNATTLAWLEDKPLPPALRPIEVPSALPAAT